MLNVMGLKSKVTGAVALGMTCLPPALHYSAVGYLKVERCVESKLTEAKLQWLSFMGLQPITSGKSIDELIDAAADRYGIERKMLHSIAKAESQKNPAVMSPKSALGIMQVLGSNYKDCGLPHAAKLWDEAANTDCGAKLFAQYMKEFGNYTHTLIAYNFGPENTRQWLKRGGSHDALPGETKKYLVYVMSNYGKRTFN